MKHTDAFAAARDFIIREARLLERKLFAAEFEGAPASGVLDALRAYRNPDGGFGHALEPDKLCPESQPTDISLALQAMDAARAFDEELVRAACDFLASVSREGSLPLAFPSIEQYPRAEHWGAWTYAYGVWPTAGIAGLLHKFAFRHPWLDAATRYCWSSIEAELPNDAHALADIVVFLAHAPDRGRAERLIAKVAERIPHAKLMRLDPKEPNYGVTPLQFAPTPTSRARSLFSDEVIAGHLDRLQADQQPDGGWPITWEPPSQSARLAWHGIETLRALRVLTAYGRIQAGTGARGAG